MKNIINNFFVSQICQNEIENTGFSSRHVDELNLSLHEALIQIKQNDSKNFVCFVIIPLADSPFYVGPESVYPFIDNLYQAPPSIFFVKNSEMLYSSKQKFVIDNVPSLQHITGFKKYYNIEKEADNSFSRLIYLERNEI